MKKNKIIVAALDIVEETFDLLEENVKILSRI